MNDTCRNISDVKQITSLRVRWAHKRAGGLTKGILPHHALLANIDVTIHLETLRPVHGAG